MQPSGWTMRAYTLIRYFVFCAAGLGLGVTFASSCNVNYPTVAFRCNPRQSDNCPEDFKCCSDDPAAVNGMLPSYTGREDLGSTPIFSDNNNVLGTQGMCVRTADIPPGFTLLAPNAVGCPIPCNPTWVEADIASVCGGPTFKCCQTVKLDPLDCILDGETYRPVTGADILTNNSTWSPSSHETHQDPNGTGCAQFAMSADIDDPTYSDCLSNLSVANQRGYCMNVLGCPTVIDACTQINMGLIPPPGGAPPTTGTTG